MRSPCLSPGDRKIIEIELRPDDLYYAIDDIVRAAARRFPPPAPLVADLHTWLNSYENTEDEPRFRRLINQLTTRAIPACLDTSFVLKGEGEAHVYTSVEELPAHASGTLWEPIKSP